MNNNYLTFCYIVSTERQGQNSTRGGFRIVNPNRDGQTSFPTAYMHLDGTGGSSEYKGCVFLPAIIFFHSYHQ